jgi:hypothetical protein
VFGINQMTLKILKAFYPCRVPEPIDKFVQKTMLRKNLSILQIEGGLSPAVSPPLFLWREIP